jgi:small subunit ribosomal protein S5
MLHPASKGTGIIAWGAIRKVLMVAWYSDILAKKYGSSNHINNARATIEALSSFK